MNLATQVQTNIVRKRLARKGETLLVGVSGGSDSIALLHVLSGLQHALAFQLRAVHFNHQLRTDCRQDEELVQRFCHSLNVPCRIVRLTVKRTKNQSSVEDAARQSRLRHLKRISKKHGAERVALAHHRDDCAETVLMHILRGTGLQGLKGIPPQTRFNALTIIRPFYNVPKADILRYLRTNKIQHREDYTNREDCYLRNTVRRKLIPFIERHYQPNIKELLFQLANISADDYACLAAYGQKQFRRVLIPGSSAGTVKIHLQRLVKLHPSLQRIIFRLAYEKLQGDLTRLTLKHVQEIEDLVENRKLDALVHLPNRVTVCKAEHTLILKRRKP